MSQATRTSGIISVQFMLDPLPGPTGLTPRLSVWKAGERYRNDTDNTDIAPRYIDYVTDVDVALLGETEYHVYRCVKQHLSDDNTRKPGNTEYWTEISSGYGPLIAPLLLSRKIIADFIDVTSLAADSAFIDNLTVKRLDCIPSSGTDKLVIKGNELSVINGDGDYKVRIFGGSIKGSCDGGKHEYYFDEATTFEDDTNVLYISGGSLYAYKNIKPKEFDLGYLPKGSTIVVPNLFQLTCGFTVNCNGYHVSGKNMVVSDNSRKRICKTNISVNIAVIDKSTGEQVFSFSATDEYGQNNVPILSDDVVLERLASGQVAQRSVITQVDDGSVYKILVTGTIGVNIDSETVPYDDTLTLNQITESISTATGRRIYTQEPNMLVIGSDGMFIRYDGDNGYGFIGPGGMYFKGGNKMFGVDGGGPYLQSGTVKWDVTPNGSDGLVHCAMRT